MSCSEVLNRCSVVEKLGFSKKPGFWPQHSLDRVATDQILQTRFRRNRSIHSLSGNRP